jgi:hypothetical protein
MNMLSERTSEPRLDASDDIGHTIQPGEGMLSELRELSIDRGKRNHNDSDEELDGVEDDEGSNASFDKEEEWTDEEDIDDDGAEDSGFFDGEESLVRYLKGLTTEIVRPCLDTVHYTTADNITRPTSTTTQL